jgi:ketosteroid isomerase-like protein
MGSARERILDEVAGTLKDVLHELDSRETNVVLEDDEASAVGETLRELAMYIHSLRFYLLLPIVASPD